MFDLKINEEKIDTKTHRIEKKLKMTLKIPANCTIQMLKFENSG